MQKYLLTIIAVISLASCKKWLDVKPESQVTDDELFETEAGFEEALNGSYLNSAGGAVYGFELTAGLPEVLAQNYTMASSDDLKYLQTSLYNYKDADFISRKDDIWSTQYNTIANLNKILENLETHKGVVSPEKYDLIKGEALAYRAYLHFDLLRLFGPSYATEPGTKAIPYVTSFTNKTTSLSTVTEALQKMVTDLDSAKTLLKPVDPILAATYLVGYPGDTTTSKELTSKDLFLQNRRHRFNYYAACGTLARVYLYMDKKQEALTNALEIIDAKKFPFTKTDDFINADPEEKDRILYPELIFCWYNESQYASYTNAFDAGTTGLYIEQNAGNSIYETGGAGGEDLRFKQWFLYTSDVSGARYELQKYQYEDETNLHPYVAPALRLSEMYYIAAECTWEADQAKALGYLNTVRNNRGISADVSATTKEDFISELLKEARKEMYAEGQLFYMYKRLNRGIIGLTGSTIATSKSIFVLPLPDDEIEYGQR